eukprot:486257_1
MEPTFIDLTSNSIEDAIDLTGDDIKIDLTADLSPILSYPLLSYPIISYPILSITTTSTNNIKPQQLLDLFKSTTPSTNNFSYMYNKPPPSHKPYRFAKPSKRNTNRKRQRLQIKSDEEDDYLIAERRRLNHSFEITLDGLVGLLTKFKPSTTSTVTVNDNGINVQSGGSIGVGQVQSGGIGQVQSGGIGHVHNHHHHHHIIINN